MQADDGDDNEVIVSFTRSELDALNAVLRSLSTAETRAVFRWAHEYARFLGAWRKIRTRMRER